MSERNLDRLAPPSSQQFLEFENLNYETRDTSRGFVYPNQGRSATSDTYLRPHPIQCPTPSTFQTTLHNSPGSTEDELDLDHENDHDHQYPPLQIPTPSTFPLYFRHPNSPRMTSPQETPPSPANPSATPPRTRPPNPSSILETISPGSTVSSATGSAGDGTGSATPEGFGSRAGSFSGMAGGSIVGSHQRHGNVVLPAGMQWAQLPGGTWVQVLIPQHQPQYISAVHGHLPVTNPVISPSQQQHVNYQYYGQSHGMAQYNPTTQQPVYPPGYQVQYQSTAQQAPYLANTAGYSTVPGGYYQGHQQWRVAGQTGGHVQGAGYAVHNVQHNVQSHSVGGVSWPNQVPGQCMVAGSSSMGPANEGVGQSSGLTAPPQQPVHQPGPSNVPQNTTESPVQQNDPTQQPSRQNETGESSSGDSDETNGGDSRFKARQFQLDFYRAARRSNIIAFLDTGSGKTFISVLLIKEIGVFERARASENWGGRRVIFFLVPKKVLVGQQANVLKSHTNLNIGEYCGDTAAEDRIINSKVEKDLKRKDVFVMTPQLLLNALRFTSLTMKKIALIVFDECHHARKKHPYNLIMQEFYHPTPKPNRPKIFGMTASLVDKRTTSQVDAGFRELELNLDCTIMTTNPTEVEKYAAKAQEAVLVHTKSLVIEKVPECNRLIDRAIARLTACNKLDELEKSKRQWRRHGSSSAWKADTKKKGPCDQKIRQLANLKLLLEDMGVFPAICALIEMLEEPEVSEIENYYHYQRSRMAYSMPDDDDSDDSDGPRRGPSSAQATRPAASSHLPIDNPSAPSDTAGGGTFSVDNALDPILENYSEIRGDNFSDQVAVKFLSFRDAVLALTLGVLGDLQRSQKFLDENKVPRTGGSDKVLGEAARALLNGRIDFEGVRKEVPKTLTELGGENTEVIVSHKMLQLFRFLWFKKKEIEHEDGGAKWRGMIFVEQTLTAVVLEQVLRRIPELKFFKCQSLTGHGGTVASTAMEDTHQRKIVNLFRNGKINLLISTSVAEEGLDITDCQLVVRFDLPKTEAASIQSRGRARKENSLYVMIREKDNTEQMQHIERLKAAEEAMKEFAKRINPYANANVEADEDLISGTDLANQEINAAKQGGMAIVNEEGVEVEDESTGCKISESAAVDLIYRYCAQLPQDEYCTLRPEFLSTEDVVGGRSCYQFQLTLPTNCPVKTPFIGPKSESKSKAKGAVCLLACHELRNQGELNNSFLPAMSSERDALRDDARKLTEASRKAQRQEWMVENPINPVVLEWDEYDNDLEKLGGSEGGEVFRGPPPGLNCEPISLHLHVAELSVVKRAREGGDCEVAVPRKIGLLTLKKLEHLMSFPIFPEFMQVDVNFSYVGELSLERSKVRTLKTYHYAVLEGAYFKNKLFTSLSFPEHLKKHDFFKQVSEDLSSLPIDIGDYQQHGLPPPTNKSWYILTPIVDNQETFPVNDRSDSVHGWPGKWGDRSKKPWGRDKEGERKLGYAKKPESIESWIDWALLGKVVGRVKNLSATGIGSEGIRKLKRGDVLVSSYNPAVYELLGVRDDLSVDSRFPAKPKFETKRNPGKEEMVEKVITEHPELATRTDSDTDSLEESDYSTFREYYAKRWNFCDLQADQPLLECRRVRKVSVLKRARNSLRKGWNAFRAVLEDLQEEGGAKGLDSGVETQSQKSKGSFLAEAVHVLPQFMVLYPLDCEFRKSLSVIVAVLWCFESILKVTELGHFLCEGHLQSGSIPIPDTHMLLESMTSKNCQEFVNYERLEFIGDAVLKYAASMHTFWSYPTAHEGMLTKRREGLVSNLKLAKVAVELNLHKYIRHIRLGDHPWKPAGCQFLDAFWVMMGGDAGDGATWYGGKNKKASERNEDHQKQAVRVKYKFLADIVEALIGAFYVHNGIQAAFTIIDRMGLVPAKFLFKYTGGGSDDWMKDVQTACSENDAEIPAGLKAFAVSRMGKGFKSDRDVSELERALNYTFKDKTLALEALTHCSWKDPDPPCYQRLEYLGDAVLDMMITKQMYDRYGQSNPGQLTHLRQATVNNEKLAFVALKLALQRFLIHSSPYLHSHIESFVQQSTKISKVPSRDRKTTMSFGVGQRHAPKVMGDVVESLIGATYIDTFGSLGKTWQVWGQAFAPLHTPDTVPMHPVRELLELCQAVHMHVSFKRVPNPDMEVDQAADQGCSRFGVGGNGRRRGQGRGGALNSDDSIDDRKEREENELDIEASVSDGKESLLARRKQNRKEFLFDVEKSGKHAVMEYTEESNDPDIHVVVLVNGEKKGEGQGTHIRSARREAAMSALEGSFASMRRCAKEPSLTSRGGGFGRSSRGRYSGPWGSGLRGRR